MSERSKELDSSSSNFGCVGSNPTECIFFASFSGTNCYFFLRVFASCMECGCLCSFLAWHVSEDSKPVLLRGRRSSYVYLFAFDRTYVSVRNVRVESV